MELKYQSKCCVCKKVLLVGSNAYGLKVGREWVFLCDDCRARAGGCYSHRKIIEAWYLQFSDEFGGPECEADHEDYRILENLGVKSLYPGDED